MVRKILKITYNGIKYIGNRNYRNLLCVDTGTRINKDKDAILNIGSKFRTRKNVEINIRGYSVVNIGQNVFINSGCIITSREKISIGNGTIFGPNVMVYDNDHRIKDGQVIDNEYETAPIIIGNHVWIGAGTIILKGSVIEDNCVIAAGSIVKGRVTKGNIFLQKRNTTIIPIQTIGGQEENTIEA